jgi:hypothetical protein
MIRVSGPVGGEVYGEQAPREEEDRVVRTILVLVRLPPLELDRALEPLADLGERMCVAGPLADGEDAVQIRRRRASGLGRGHPEPGERKHAQSQTCR